MSMTKRWLEKIGYFDEPEGEDFVDDLDYQYQEYLRKRQEAEFSDNDDDDEG